MFLMTDVECMECGNRTTDPVECIHDRTQCPDCYQSLACVACANPRSHR